MVTVYVPVTAGFVPSVHSIGRVYDGVVSASNPVGLAFTKISNTGNRYQNGIRDLKKKFFLRKSKDSVERIYLCNVTEKLTEH